MVKVKMGLPKGSLEENAQEIMEQVGFSIKWRGYKGWVEDPRIKLIIKLRPQDIPLYVARGNLDLGISGQDCILERRLEKRVFEIASLPFTKSGGKLIQLVLFVPQNSEIQTLADIRPGMRVATEYPNITEEYFKKQGIKVEIDVTHGATEAVVAAGFAAAGVDVVDQGTALLENGLRVVGTIMKSSTVLIVSPHAWGDVGKRKSIEEIRTVLVGVMTP